MAILVVLLLCFSGSSFQFSTRAQTIDSINNFVRIGNGSRSEKPLSYLDKTLESSFDDSYQSNLVSASGPTGSVFFVAPNGTESGDGSINDPWNLKSALSHPASVKPGDTIYLLGGTYKLPPETLGFTSLLKGTFENPIKVMSYPGEWAVIDGNLSDSALKNVTMIIVLGQYTWYKDFEVTNSETGNRKIPIASSNPPERRGTAIDDRGTGTKLINLVIHDAGQGISSYSNGKNGEYYGNVVYNNGWDAPDRTHGHGSYTQNNSDFKRFENNFFFNNFKNNTQMYGSDRAFCRNFTWVGNVFFNGSMAWWGPNIENLTVTDNYTYRHFFKVGNSLSSTNIKANIQNNYFMYGVFLDEFTQNVTFKNNTIWYDLNEQLLTLNLKNFWAKEKFSIDNNTYYKGKRNAPYAQFEVYYKGNNQRAPLVKRLTGEFAFNRTDGSQQTAYAYHGKSWQDDLNFDTNSKYIDSAPSGLKVFVQSNKYESGRANIIIYNWDKAQTVEVDIASTLNPGDSYQLRNVQDYFGDVITGVYSGGKLKVNMTERTRAKPIGYDEVSSWYHDPLRPNTFPTFGAFVLIKTKPQ